MCTATPMRPVRKQQVHDRPVIFRIGARDEIHDWRCRIRAGTVARILGLLCALILASVSLARADVGVVLNESLPTGGDRISRTGHSAVYFSRICPESPVKLRLCGAGEHGSILSNYTGFGETEPFDWNITPLGVFLYGSEDPRHWPLVGTAKIKSAIEERYRERYLAAYCPGAPCATNEKADWRDMAGAGLSRNIYIFVVETSAEQDRELIQKFNALPNKNHFNAITRNCADFTRDVINTYFPNAARPEYLNDFGMKSPKAIARSFTHYAEKHPELKLRVLHFAQVQGTIKRSTEVRDGTEQLYRSTIFAVPLALASEYALPAAFAIYGLTGRFNPEHEWEARPTLREAEIEEQLRAAKADKNEAEVARLKNAEREERKRILGTDEDWEGYRRELRSMTEEAAELGIISGRKFADSIFDQLGNAGTPYFDAKGGMWIPVTEGERIARLGVSTSNVLAPGSDPKLAYRLLLARTERALKSPKRSRQTLVDFRVEWKLLEAARRRVVVQAAGLESQSQGKARRDRQSEGASDGGDE